MPRLDRTHLWPLRLLAYEAVVVVLTWPLALQLGDTLPVGTEDALTVPLYNLWALRWNADRLGHLYVGYWNAPIFHPEPGALALSETLLPQGVVFALGDAIFGRPVFVYNVLLLAILVLNAQAASRLLLTLRVAAPAAFLGGIVAAALPFVSNEMGVVQLCVLFPIFYCLDALRRYTVTGRGGARLGIWTGLTALTCSYYGLMLTVFMVPAAVCLGRRAHLARRPLAELAAAGLLACAVALPILLTQANLTENQHRDRRDVARGSADWVDYAALDEHSVGGRWLPWLKPIAVHPLYPGTVLLVLGALGAHLGSVAHPRWVLFCLLGLLVAFVLSLGTNLSLGPLRPFEILGAYVPGFAQMRNAFRFGVFTQIFLLSLSGYALHALWSWRGRIGPALCICLVVLGCIEVAAPTVLRPAPRAALKAPWIDFLRAQPDGAVIVLPVAEYGPSRGFEATVVAMLQGLEHRKPLVNGYSGMLPASNIALAEWNKHFPSQPGASYLRRTGVAYLVIGNDWWTAQRRRQLAHHGDVLEAIYRDDTTRIYRVKEK